MKLNGQQYKQLTEALLDAFPEQQRLAELVQIQFEKNLNAIAMGSDLRAIVYKLIQAAQAQGWIDQLIVGAHEFNPNNEKLSVFAQELNLVIPPSELRAQGALESDRDLIAAKKQQGIKHRWAFLVGVNRYIDHNFGTLKFCVDDVLALEKTLTQIGYTVVCLHDRLDRDDPLFPSRDNIEAKLIEICNAVQRDDLFWVHFSCHGTLVEKADNQKEAVLIAQDTRYSLLKQRALSVNTVEQYIKNSKARRLILTLDACHSGVEMGRDITDPEFIHNVYELAEGFALIAASTAQQVAFEWLEKQHGVFTYQLLEGLSGVADRSGKNFVSVDDLKTHVLDGLRRWGLKNSRIQEPTARTEGFGDMILADYRKNSDLRENFSNHPPVEQKNTAMTSPKALKKQALQKQYDALVNRYNKLTEQIMFTVNVSDRTQLELQRDNIYQEMEEIEQQIQQ
ncbi:MAG: effector-associated domain EAD1-containing protein [Scytonema sp. PMC 1069.18]|nr:effector-associated domain EAD1-containing protein [Scytonema sp. PMC 1069.18]MEC4888022.1 effector-associated domain EAD1-containing protein [Scytonema sp. PMC 1070.18]